MFRCRQSFWASFLGDASCVCLRCLEENNLCRNRKKVDWHVCSSKGFGCTPWGSHSTLFVMVGTPFFCIKIDGLVDHCLLFFFLVKRSWSVPSFFTKGSPELVLRSHHMLIVVCIRLAAFVPVVPLFPSLHSSCRHLPLVLPLMRTPLSTNEISENQHKTRTATFVGRWRNCRTGTLEQSV